MSMHSTRAPMSDTCFARWATLIERRLGMQIPPDRRHHLESQLSIALRERGANDFDQYYQWVTGPEADPGEWVGLIDRVTIQETRFFRDPDALQCAARHALELARQLPPDVCLDAWSVGCATGEETYSLAMTLHDALSGFPERRFSVSGTDISNKALTMARGGCYPERKLRNLDAEQLQRHFLAGTQPGSWCVKPVIRARTGFFRLNVLDLKDAPFQDMHLIFCQNMLIYFRKWRRRLILDALAERLRPGGLLVIGMGEVTDWHHPALQRKNEPSCLAWQKRD